MLPLATFLLVYLLVHQSICKVKSTMKLSNQIEFSKITSEAFAIKTKYNTRKASPIDCIPAKILKESSDLFSVAIKNLLNPGLSKGTAFPMDLKAGDRSSLFKKENAFSKKSYRLITVLPPVSKVYERLMLDQMLPLSKVSFCPKSMNNGKGGFRGCLHRPLESVSLSKS